MAAPVVRIRMDDDDGHINGLADLQLATTKA